MTETHRSSDLSIKPDGVGTPHASTKPATSLFLSTGTAFLWAATSVTMNFVNKYTMMIFPLTNIIMVLQMLATWAILQPLRDSDIVKFPPFNIAQAKKLFLITCLYTANVVFSLLGLKTLNMPMYQVLKRMTPLIVLVVKAIVKRKLPRTDIILSVVVIVGGCIIAGMGDLSFDPMGYMFALLSCLVQAGYLLLVEFQAVDGISSSEMLYYNAVTSLPMLFVIVFVTGEASHLPGVYASAVAKSGLITVWFNVILTAILGVVLNYTLFLCVEYNSALTTTIVGVLKSVVSTVLGFFLLGGVKFYWVNVSGITMNTLGGAWYTAIKYREKQAMKESKALSLPTVNSYSSPRHHTPLETDALLNKEKNSVFAGHSTALAGEHVAHRRPVAQA